MTSRLVVAVPSELQNGHNDGPHPVIAADVRGAVGL